MLIGCYAFEVARPLGELAAVEAALGLVRRCTFW